LPVSSAISIRIMIDGAIRDKSMDSQDELAELEAERDQLQSMIAYQEHSGLRLSLPPLWLLFVVAGVTCGIGFLIVAGVVAGQIDLSFAALSMVFLILAAYILTRKIDIFGASFRISEIFGAINLAPEFRTPGEPQIRQRLSDCETRIKQLKERRS
jgi:Flp pilus assembly protein TadB